MSLRTTITAAALLLSVAGSALAADGPMGAMSKMDSDKMAACKGMTPDAMKKDKGCMAMAKAHPDAMKATGAMGAMGAKDHMGASGAMGAMAPKK